MDAPTPQDIVFFSIRSRKLTDLAETRLSLDADLRRDLRLANLDITMVAYKIQETCFEELSCVIQIGGRNVSEWRTVGDIVSTVTELINKDREDYNNELE